jgi:hypothetical protein
MKQAVNEQVMEAGNHVLTGVNHVLTAKKLRFDGKETTF